MRAQATTSTPLRQEQENPGRRSMGFSKTETIALATIGLGVFATLVYLDYRTLDHACAATGTTLDLFNFAVHGEDRVQKAFNQFNTNLKTDALISLGTTTLAMMGYKGVKAL